MNKQQTKLEGQSCVTAPDYGTTKYQKYNQSPKGQARTARRNAELKDRRALERERRIWKNRPKTLDNYGRYGGTTLGERRKAARFTKDRPAAGGGTRPEMSAEDKEKEFETRWNIKKRGGAA